MIIIASEIRLSKRKNTVPAKGRPILSENPIYYLDKYKIIKNLFNKENV